MGCMRVEKYHSLKIRLLIPFEWSYDFIVKMDAFIVKYIICVHRKKYNNFCK